MKFCYCNCILAVQCSVNKTTEEKEKTDKTLRKY